MEGQVVDPRYRVRFRGMPELRASADRVATYRVLGPAARSVNSLVPADSMLQMRDEGHEEAHSIVTSKSTSKKTSEKQRYIIGRIHLRSRDTSKIRYIIRGIYLRIHVRRRNTYE